MATLYYSWICFSAGSMEATCHQRDMHRRMQRRRRRKLVQTSCITERSRRFRGLDERRLREPDRRVTIVAHKKGYMKNAQQQWAFLDELRSLDDKTEGNLCSKTRSDIVRASCRGRVCRYV